MTDPIEAAAEALVAAAKSGNPESLRVAIDQIPSYLTYNEFGRALHFTISRDYLPTNFRPLQCFKLLLDHGAGLNLRDNEGDTPLHCAARNNSFLTHLELLTARGAPLEEKNRLMETPLHLACRHSAILCVRHLLDKGAQWEVVARYGTPLHYTCKYRGIDRSEAIAQLLLDYGANVEARNHQNETPLHVACYHDRLDCAKVFLDSGSQIEALDNNRFTPLITACTARSLECLAFLISKNADVNARALDESTALHFVCSMGDAYGEAYGVPFLVPAGELDDDSDVYSPDDSHVYGVQIVEALIAGGADVNVVDADGCTPLHISCKECVPDYITLLIQAGADVTRMDDNGNTPLHFAAGCGGDLGAQLAIIRTLRRAGADKFALNDRGEPPRALASSIHVSEHLLRF